MLAAALRAEADAFVAQIAEEVLPDGRQRVVRHGMGRSAASRPGLARSTCAVRRHLFGQITTPTTGANAAVSGLVLGWRCFVVSAFFYAAGLSELTIGVFPPSDRRFS